MTDTELSLREASKLLQFAPQTVKKMIAKGEIKAKYTGKGKMRRYTINAKDLPKNGSAPKKRGRPAKAAKQPWLKAKLDGKTTVGTRFVSEVFAAAPDLPPAEQMLRTCFLNWCTKKLLAE